MACCEWCSKRTGMISRGLVAEKSSKMKLELSFDEVRMSWLMQRPVQSMKMRIDASGLVIARWRGGGLNS